MSTEWFDLRQVQYCEVVMQCAYQCRQSARWLQGGYFYALKTSLEPYVKGLD